MREVTFDIERPVRGYLHTMHDNGVLGANAWIANNPVIAKQGATESIALNYALDIAHGWGTWSVRETEYSENGKSLCQQRIYASNGDLVFSCFRW